MYYLIDKLSALDEFDEEEMENIKNIISNYSKKSSTNEIGFENFKAKGDAIHKLIDDILTKLEIFFIENKIRTLSYFHKYDQFHIIKIKILDGKGKFRISFFQENPAIK